jgi:site-specific DNA-methyltransferase (adenine-specific)
MEPYYQDDAVTIYHGDCREILPTLSKVDTVFTSPPYNTISPTKPSGMMREFNHKQNRGYLSHKDNMPEQEYQKWLLGTLEQCRSLCANIMWVNHKTRYRSRVGIHPLSFMPWPLYSEIIWDRRGSITLNAKKFAPSHEYIFGFGIPVYWDRVNDMKMSVWRVNPERSIDGHPCPFPLAVVSPCIDSSTPPGGTVLDPFMGSGTTLRAAKDLGRKAIGIEIEEKYCEIAAKRMVQEVMF